MFERAAQEMMMNEVSDGARQNRKWAPVCVYHNHDNSERGDVVSSLLLAVQFDEAINSALKERTFPDIFPSPTRLARSLVTAKKKRRTIMPSNTPIKGRMGERQRA